MKLWILAVVGVLIAVVATRIDSILSYILLLGDEKMAEQANVGDPALAIHYGKECEHWFRTGRSIALGIAIDDDITVVEAFRRAAECNPGNYLAWVELGVALGPTDTVKVGDTVTNQVRAYVEGVKGNPEKPESLHLLALAMGKNAKITIDGDKLDRFMLTKRAVELSMRYGGANNSVSSGWQNLAAYLMDDPTRMTVELEGKRYNLRDLLVQSLLADRTRAEAAFVLSSNLRPMDRVEIPMGPEGVLKTMDRTDLRALAVELESSKGERWRALSEVMLSDRRDSTVTVSGASLGVGEVIARALELSEALPDRARLWYYIGLGLSGSATFTSTKGEKFRKADALYRATKIDPTLLEAWGKLCEEIPNRGQIKLFDGKFLTRRTCYMKTLELRPESPATWNNVASQLDDTETVEFNGRKYNPTELMTRAVELAGDAEAVPYFNLAQRLLRDDQFVTVNGATMNKFNLLEKAVNIDGGYHDAWGELAKFLPDGQDHIIYRGKKLTMQEMMERFRTRFVPPPQ